MILGVRLLSTNLSGQTAEVTFLPISGGSIDLGIQTIPFNYLNNNPYGTYEIYVPLYDYTYEVVVTEPPVNTRQSFAVLTYQTGTTTYNVAALNFTDFTAELISFDLSNNDWYDTGFFFTNESGYIFSFNGQADSDDYLKIYTTEYGIEIGRYSANTNSANYYNLNNFGYVFFDYGNGKVSHFDGFNVSLISYDQNNQSADLLSSYDEVTENRSFLLRIQTYSSSTYDIYLVNSSGQTLIDSYDYTLYNKNFSVCKSAKFIVITTYDTMSTYYTDVKLVSQVDGSTIQTFTLNSNTYYDSPSLDFFGKNKLLVYFYNYGDNSVPYSIYYYNGDTDTSDVLIKTRGTEYNYNQYYTSRAYNNYDSDSGSLVMLFWDGFYDSSFLSGYSVNYLDIVYIIDGTDTFTTYTYQNSGTLDKSLSLFNSSIAKTFYTWGNTGDGNYSVITIGESGVTYIPVLPYPFNRPLDRWTFGDRYVQMLWTDYNFTGATLYLYSDGLQQDSIFFDRPNNWNYGYRYGVFQIDNDVDFWYVNNSVTAFTQADFYDYVRFQNSFFTDSGHGEDTAVVLLNTNNGNTAIIGLNTFTTGNTLPINGGSYQIRVGKDKFIYIYNQPTWLGKIVIELYDFNFNLLNSVTTDYTDWDNTYAVKDRYVVTFFDNNTDTYDIYLVSESTIDNVKIGDFYYYQINDILWD